MSRSIIPFRYFKSDLDTKFMFIPQMLFLGCIFMYLCVQIIVKWLFFDAGVCYSILLIAIPFRAVRT